VKFIVNHLKNLFNSLLKSTQLMQEIDKNTQTPLLSLQKTQMDLKNLKANPLNFFSNVAENIKLTDERLDVHSQLLQ